MTEPINLTDRVVAVLAEHGVRNVPAAEVAVLADHLYGEVELAVGRTLSAGLSEEQLLEFERCIDAGDEAGSNAFLQREVPNYREITTRILDETIEHLRATLAARYLGGSQ